MKEWKDEREEESTYTIDIHIENDSPYDDQT